MFFSTAAKTLVSLKSGDELEPGMNLAIMNSRTVAISETAFTKRGFFMEKSNVIEFPKKNSLRKRLQDRAQDQKAVLSLSIASVLVVSLFLNQWLVGSGNSSQVTLNQSSRGIASFNDNFAQDVKWEHDFAKELSQKEFLGSAKLAEKPTMRDELVFGYLQGKYGMKLSKGHIESLDFIDAQSGEQPIVIDKKDNFLLNFRDAFGLDFRQVSVTGRTATEETYSLVDSAKTIIGSARFALDDQGRVTSVKISQ